MTSIKNYIINILIAIDQLINTILLGDPDETISSRAYRMKDLSFIWNTVRNVIDIIFFFDIVKTGNGDIIYHCQLSFLFYIKRRQSTSKKYHDDVKELLKEIRNHKVTY